MGQVKLLDAVGISRDKANPALETMAKLGSWGKTKGNVHRDLLRALGTPDTCPAPIHIQCPCVTPKPQPGRSKIQDIGVPFLGPHLLFHHIYFTITRRFNELISVAKTLRC